MFDSTVLLGVVMFTITVLALVGVILFARSKLVSAGNVTILINDDPDKAVEVPAGGKLLGTLASSSLTNSGTPWAKLMADGVGFSGLGVCN